MKLTFAQLELVLARHLRVHPDKQGTLRSRIKQLQRLQFPPGVNVGRGSKMEYTGEHLFMLVSAFELISLSLPAQTATTVVTDHWDTFAAGYALAALRFRELPSPSEENGVQILAVLKLRGMHEIQFSSSRKSLPSELRIQDETVARSELRPYDHHEDYSRIFISIGLLTKRVLKIAIEQAGVHTSIHDNEFNGWLPKGENRWISFATRYPDRSNIDQRKALHAYFGSDPESLTPEGVEEGRLFAKNEYTPDYPF